MVVIEKNNDNGPEKYTTSSESTYTQPSPQQGRFDNRCHALE
jgi:hypothetical protein